jgi:anaerobic magnesium-protoporphyrin IX monomethyl ester cyclase
MRIHILQVAGHPDLRSNKDTNGGYGTVNDFGKGLVPRLLKDYKNRSMNFPEILPAYVNAILKGQGHAVSYACNVVPDGADIVLIQTSIVNFQHELDWARKVKHKWPQVKVGFIGSMSGANPRLYQDKADFVVVGEVENALLDKDVASFSGIVEGGMTPDLDQLPFPDWSHIQTWKKGYGLVSRGESRLLPMSSSRGCPMTCGYYCTYPLTQGKKLRTRSPELVVDEAEYLQKNFGMTAVMFRDPIFSLKMERVEQICELILKRNLHFSWICETHPHFLTPELIKLMRRAGCITVKLGIESGDLDVMKKSGRALPNLEHQEFIVDCCETNGIQVLAFYILGYMHDTRASILQTIEYAQRLNTYGAQFTIATPYPGTQWFTDLETDLHGFSLDEDYEHYNQYRLVFKHPNLSFAELEELKSLAYRRYYLSFAFMVKNVLHLSFRANGNHQDRTDRG